MKKKTVWQQIESENESSNVELIVSADDCKIMRVENGTGEGLLTMYEIFPGIYLMYCDYHMADCGTGIQNAGTILSISHCREGRLEMEGDGIYYFQEQGDLLIDTKVHHAGKMRFPLSHFHGITIAFQPGHAESALKELMPSLEIDLYALAEKFCAKDKTYLIRNDAVVENIFAQLYRVPKKSRRDYFRIKILELLVYLRDLDFEENKKDKVYFYKTQVEKVHAIQALITEDLTRNYTQEQLAERFSIGITQMKQCFKAVYGQPIYAYLRTARMNCAAELLITEKNRKVTDIAAACGYESTAKFGQAFKKEFQMPPLEYRKFYGRKEM